MSQNSTSTSRSLTRAAVWVFVGGLVPSVVLGLSGDETWAGVGNVVLLLTVLTAAALLVLALFSRRK